MMKYRIRQMKPSDVSSVVRIANQSFLETARLGWLIGYRIVQRLMSNRECLFIAETDRGDLAGFVVGELKDNKAVINWIAVHPSHRSRGVGGMLLKAVEEKAREKGIRIVETGTPFARPFYEKYGYKCVDIRRSMLLELVGRSISIPKGLRIRTIMLEELPMLLDFIGDENEWLRFAAAYFEAYESDPEKAILITNKNNEILGVAIGRSEKICSELVTLSYIFAKKKEDTIRILNSLAYLASSHGHRWLGISLPIAGITEEQLKRAGWQDAKLPFFWTMYRMRKKL